jgi:hypothetical protein
MTKHKNPILADVTMVSTLRIDRAHGHRQEGHSDPCAEYRRMVEASKEQQARILEDTAKS